MLYSRVGCLLCEEMLEEIAAIPRAAALGIDVVDVDADPATRSRWGHKVPVLMLADELVCHGRLDPEELDKAIAHHCRPV